MTPFPLTGAVAALQWRLPPRLGRWANAIVCAADAYGVDELLLAAMIDRESLGGDALTPKGPSGTGDGGHGRGLAQIDDRAHPAFCAAALDGSPLWAEPFFAVLAMALLLRKRLDRFGGDPLAAVAAYNADQDRVAVAIANLPAGADRKRALDALTTDGNYVSDVLRRRDDYLSATA